MKKDILSPQFLKAGSAWIFLIFGIGFYYIGYFQINEQTVWKEICIKIGDILVIGVIIGYLTNVAQLLGIFKADLESIVYSKEFLNKRNDLEQVWENVSKHLFKSKFPAISKDLLSIIHKNYLPIENISYYNDYSVNIDLKWADKNKKLITVTNRINFELIAEEKNEILFPLKSWINVHGLNKDDYHVKVRDYTVNNKPADIVSVEEDTKDNVHCYIQTVRLKDELKYEISKTVEKQYSLDKDFVIGFRAQYIVNKLTVRFSYPNTDFEIDFMSRGTVENFKRIDSRTGFFEMKLKSIILPNQGFIIALKEK